MSKIILYDSANKVFLFLDKPYNRPTRLIRVIKANQDEQLQLVAKLKDFVDFLNKPETGIIPSYMLRLVVSPRRSS